MKIEISTLIAKVLQRMIVDEINNQLNWYASDSLDHGETRKEIISQLSSLSDEIERQGIDKFIYYR